jgi:transcriptional regulator with XRE-family HTH domain
LLVLKPQRCYLQYVTDHIFIMPKRSRAQSEMPPVVAALLRDLGHHLALARKRRKESLSAWAGRIGVSEPTLSRLEAGDPGVAIGTLATALWVMGRAQALPELAAPQLDLGALEAELRVARQRSVRSTLSLDQRLRASQAAASDNRGD